MKTFILSALLLLMLSGCRFSVSAEKLQLSAAVDQPAYLNQEDPTTYEMPDGIPPDPPE